jgi:hypothetical protein
VAAMVSLTMKGLMLKLKVFIKSHQISIQFAATSMKNLRRCNCQLLAPLCRYKITLQTDTVVGLLQENNEGKLQSLNNSAVS